MPPLVIKTMAVFMVCYLDIHFDQMVYLRWFHMIVSYRDPYVLLDILILGVSIRYTVGKFLGSDQGIILSSTDDEVFGSTFRSVDRITLGIDEVTEISSLVLSFGGLNYVNI